MAQSPEPFVPSDFEVPELLETTQLRLQPLTVNDVVRDYDAVMSSREHLRGVFGPNDTWPEDDLTLEQDLIDLGWHQKEFQRRGSFTYTVLDPSGRECLGCVYIYPTSARGYDAEVVLWVRQSAYERGLDPVLYETVRTWIAEKWPFENVAYQGREISWDEWAEITK